MNYEGNSRVGEFGRYFFQTEKFEILIKRLIYFENVNEIPAMKTFH